MKTDSHVGDEAAVQGIIEAWVAAVRHRDYEGILANHAKDIVMYDVPPPFSSVGLDAYRKTWDLFYSWSLEPVRFEIQEMTVVAGSDVAFAFAKMGCLTPDDAGEPELLDFRLTIGLKKTDGQWMIVHEHHSVPAED